MSPVLPMDVTVMSAVRPEHSTVSGLNGAITNTPDLLALRAQAGCEASFGELVKLLEPRLHNFLFQILGNTHDAEDVTQETFIRAYKGLPNFQATRASVTTWLYAIARNTAISYLRRRKPDHPMDDIEISTDVNPSQLLETKDENRVLWTLARSLRPREFEVLWLRYGEGFAVAEIARVMSLTQIHIKVLLHRARKHLAEKITQTQILQPSFL
jgi:RNA polymerase sigma-70 factor, ECF subfamily